MFVEGDMMRKISAIMAAFLICFSFIFTVPVNAEEVIFPDNVLNGRSTFTATTYRHYNVGKKYALGELKSEIFLSNISVPKFGVYGALQDHGNFMFIVMIANEPFTVLDTYNVKETIIENTGIDSIEPYFEESSYEIESIPYRGVYYAPIGFRKMNTTFYDSTFSIPYFELDDNVKPVGWYTTIVDTLLKYKDNITEIPGYHGGDMGDDGEIEDSEGTYSPEIGYLQGLEKDVFIAGSNNGGNADFTEVKYRLRWNSKSSTGLDLKQSNVYVSFYNQVVGYKKTFIGGKKEYVDGKRVYINKVAASDLMMEFYQTDINKKCKEDLEKLHYIPVLQTISRYDAEWFRIEVYDQETKTWSYGGYVKIGGKDSDKDDNAYISTWHPDENGDLVQDPDGGFGTETPIGGDIGTGETIKDAEDNASHVTPTQKAEYEDFASILDGLADGIGKFPQVVGKVFSWLPPQVIVLIVAGFSVVIVARILGR